jgi:hypothetical protein
MVTDNIQYSDDIDGHIGEDNQIETGIYLVFNADQHWTAQGEIVDGKQLVLKGMPRVVYRRGLVGEEGSKKLRFIETVNVMPGEPFPNVREWNEKLPKSEWIRNKWSKELQGPWVTATNVLLLDPATYHDYVWRAMHATKGSSQAVREIHTVIQNYRKMHGAGWCPIITLSMVHMNTEFNSEGRQRPHLATAAGAWVRFGGDAQAALPAPTPPVLTNGAAETPEPEEAEIIEATAEEVHGYDTAETLAKLKGVAGAGDVKPRSRGKLGAKSLA